MKLPVVMTKNGRLSTVNFVESEYAVDDELRLIVILQDDTATPHITGLITRHCNETEETIVVLNADELADILGLSSHERHVLTLEHMETVK